MAGKRLTPIARKLRSNPTEAEKRLWTHLRALQCGVQFTRQFGIGNSVVDFACRRLKLVIELDGGQHSASLTDDDRTCVIEAHGDHVVRFWNHDVLANPDGVLQRILEEIELARNRPKRAADARLAARSPTPTPPRGGGGIVMPLGIVVCDHNSLLSRHLLVHSPQAKSRATDRL